MNSNTRRYLIAVVLALILVHFMTLTVLAVDNFNDINKALDQQQVQQSSGSSLWVDVLKLIFILAVILGIAWSVIKLFGRKAALKMQGNWLQVIDEMMFDNNRGIVLCQAGDKVYALGVTDHNINVLFEVDNPEVIDEIKKRNSSIDRSPAGITSMKKLFSDYMRPGGGIPGPKRDFHWLMEEQVQRLENLSANSDKDRTIQTRRSDDDE